MSTILKIIILTFTLLVIIILCIFAIVTFVLNSQKNKPLESDLIRNIEVQKIIKNNRNYLLVSGEYKYSSLSIIGVKENRENDTIQVMVYATLAGNSEYDASFVHLVRLDNYVNRLVFGPDRKVIWERNSLVK